MEDTNKGKKYIAMGTLGLILVLGIYLVLMEVTGIVYTSVSALIRFIVIAIGTEVVFSVVQAGTLFTCRKFTKLIDKQVDMIKYVLCIASNYIPLWIADMFSPEVYLPFKGLIILGTILAVVELALIYYNSKPNAKGQ